MSRSTKRYCIRQNCSCKSEKFDKKIWHRRFRRAIRVSLQSGYIPDFELRIFDRKQVSDPWWFCKDGKSRQTTSSWRVRFNFLNNPGYWLIQFTNILVTKKEAHKLIKK